MEEKKKGISIPIFIIVIIIFLILGLLGGIFLSKEYLNKEDKKTTEKTTNETNKLKELNIKDEEVKDLYYLVPDNDFQVFYKDEYKGAYQNKLVTFKDLSQKTVLRTSMKYLVENTKESKSGYNTKEVTDAIYTIFNQSYEKSTIEEQTMTYLYDSQKVRWEDNYIQGTWFDFSNDNFSLVQIRVTKQELQDTQKYELYKAETNSSKKELYLYDKVYYSEIVESKCTTNCVCEEKDYTINVYDSFEKNNIIYSKKAEFDKPDPEEGGDCYVKSEITDEVYNKLKKEYSNFKYKHTFRQKDNGEYYWYSSEPIQE